MNSNLAELVKLLPPPDDPRHTTGDWDLVEGALGTRLPNDFKEFTELYGEVKICDCLVVHTPFPWSPSYPEFLLSSGRDSYEAVTGGRDNIPFPDYPSSGGLLAIGGTDSGDIVSWITEGDGPDEWGIFFWAFPGLDTYVFRELNLSGFLLDLVRLTSPLFPAAMGRSFFLPENRGVVVTGSIE